MINSTEKEHENSVGGTAKGLTDQMKEMGIRNCLLRDGLTCFA